MYSKFTFIFITVMTISSCVTVRPGEVGMVQSLGRLSDNVRPPGPVFFQSFYSKSDHSFITDSKSGIVVEFAQQGRSQCEFTNFYLV